MINLIVASSLVINLGSYHFGTEGDYEFNQANLGVGYIQEVVDSNWYSHVGVYNNSYYNTSFYGTIGYKVSTVLSFEGGAVTGYPWMDIMPVAYPVVDIGNVRMIYLPKVCSDKPDCTHVLGFQYKVEVD